MKVEISAQLPELKAGDAVCRFFEPHCAYHADTTKLRGERPVTMAPEGEALALALNIAGFKWYERDEARRSAGGTSVRTARDNGAKRLLWQLDGSVPLERFRELVTGALLAAYRFSAYKAALAKNDMKLVIGAGANATAFRRELKRLTAIDGGVSLARDLANTPPNDLTPEMLAAAGKELAARYGMQYKQINAKQLAEQGYAGITAVGQGSVHPPVLFSLTYKPKESKEGVKPLCLVGKGLCFDSGGLSIKPWDGMWDMKADMGGAACVLGAMQAIAELGLPVPVTAIVGAAENMPDGRAYRPGDIIRYKNGKTVEVHSTDAEGRMVLADALLHAQDVLQQTRIVELSTLTGACARALGRQYIGLMSRAPELAGEVLAAGKTSGELAHELPLHPEYRLLIDSSVADFKNVGGPLAGAQTAGWFLQEFISAGTQYAHLDIAGVFLADKPEKYWSQAGATGCGVRLLVALAEG